MVLSPGPGRPNDFGTAALLEELERRGLPAFGVCLGLQAMVEHAGGSLSLLDEPSHGKPGNVKVTGGGLFDGLPDEVTAARYHSLYATSDQVKGDFAPTAAIDEVVMAIEAPAEALVRGAVPPRVDPDRGGRARAPDHRERAALDRLRGPLRHARGREALRRFPALFVSAVRVSGPKR